MLVLTKFYNEIFTFFKCCYINNPAEINVVDRFAIL